MSSKISPILPSLIVIVFPVAGRKAASKMTKTATALSSKTGLDYVVRPIQSGISSGVGHVSSGVGHMSSVAGTVTSHVMSMPSGMRRRSSSLIPSGAIGRSRFVAHGDGNVASNVSTLVSIAQSQYIQDCNLSGSDFVLATLHGLDPTRFRAPGNDADSAGRIVVQSNSGPLLSEKVDPDLVYPEQDIDISGPSTGKKLTDDLAEIKDKMHELTWHLFDDHTFVIKNPDAVFFGDVKKPEKRRKADPSKQIKKYLHMGQYSHSNPFVARVGMYVEPIIGSTYSLLCFFRAGFNVVTWRDPILTFWLSFGCGIIVIILFFFPWRIFLFVVGFLVVGPQNWVIRILREQGHLSPVPKYENKTKAGSTEIDDLHDFLLSQPVFTKDNRKSGNDPRRPTDPTIDRREIHHVVVPYGPLVHQRCNDWPPEPEYAQVKRNASSDDVRQRIAGAYQFRRNDSLASDEPSNDANRITRGLRRRFRRGEPSSPSQGIPPTNPYRNRGSSED